MHWVSSFAVAVVVPFLLFLLLLLLLLKGTTSACLYTYKGASRRWPMPRSSPRLGAPSLPWIRICPFLMQHAFTTVPRSE